MIIMLSLFGWTGAGSTGEFNLVSLDDLNGALEDLDVASMFPDLNDAEQQNLLDAVNDISATDQTWTASNIQSLDYTDYDGTSASSFSVRNMDEQLCNQPEDVGGETYVVGKVCNSLITNQEWEWRMHSLYHVEQDQVRRNQQFIVFFFFFFNASHVLLFSRGPLVGNSVWKSFLLKTLQARMITPSGRVLLMTPVGPASTAPTATV